MIAIAEPLPVGARVRKASRWGGTAGRNQAGTVVREPYETKPGFWYVDVRFDGRTQSEPVYLARLSREAS